MDSHPRRPQACINLEWRKWRGKYRFCYTHHDYEFDEYLNDHEATEDVTPYDEWSAERRVEMLEFVPALFENAVKQIEKFIAKTKIDGGNNENASN